VKRAKKPGFGPFSARGMPAAILMGMKTKIKSIVILLCAAVLTVAATGCRHTAEGFGEDMEKAGEKIQDKAR
jgi:predicted small secreted protein